ncbi:MAG: ASKHA domain-containing protein [Thermoguttaceae bacterium]|nr:ASKHA domain-containing protein [Thermoguttaceae bacterium]MDW8079072.1 ASKHA domain-containing protein [Thermoguttaceae bacterium]
MSGSGPWSVRFEPHGKRVLVPDGTLLAEAAAMAGLALEQACGGRGQCGRCRIVIRHPQVEPSPVERKFFVVEELEEGWRLACQIAVHCDMVVEIPVRSLAVGCAQILAEHHPLEWKPAHPPVRKTSFNFSPNELATETALLAHVEKKLGPVFVPLAVARKVAELNPHQKACWTAVVEMPEPVALSLEPAKATEKHEEKPEQVAPEIAVSSQGRGAPTGAGLPTLLDLRAGGEADRLCAVAFDIGTTTIVANLVDLSTGRVLAVASAVNPQIRFGEDVISRIELCRRHSDGTSLLYQAVHEACRGLLENLCTDAGISRRDIFVATFAGNTTMLHLVAGINPASLGEAPFRPVFKRELICRAEDLGLPIHPLAQVYIFPVIGPFVGGDTIAGMLAVRLWERPSPALLVDIGTNGEIVLSHPGKLVATATAAGPAFEGVRIRCGMRAVAGAIERLRLADGELSWEVIGPAQPAGLCGSGLVDLVALLLQSGIVTTSGRMLSPEEAAEQLPDKLSKRLLRVDGRPAFEVVPGTASASGQSIVFTQQDVRQLQLAAGAIRAGVTVLCQLVGVDPGELQEVWVAGAFGNYLRPESAQAIGLLPQAIPTQRIRFAGNTSLAGATLAAVSLEARALARWLADSVRHVELALLPEFRRAFAEGMIFPDPRPSPAL